MNAIQIKDDKKLIQILKDGNEVCSIGKEKQLQNVIDILKVYDFNQSLKSLDSMDVCGIHRKAIGELYNRNRSVASQICSEELMPLVRKYFLCSDGILNEEARALIAYQEKAESEEQAYKENSSLSDMYS